MNGNQKDLITWFHTMWDCFPGMVRLIDERHHILAANDTAIQAGFEPGLCCARVGTPESHKGCLAGKMIKTGEAQTERMSANKIRAWIPVKGYDGIFVHYTLLLPAQRDEQ